MKSISEFVGNGLGGGAGSGGIPVDRERNRIGRTVYSPTPTIGLTAYAMLFREFGNSLENKYKRGEDILVRMPDGSTAEKDFGIYTFQIGLAKSLSRVAGQIGGRQVQYADFLNSACEKIRAQRFKFVPNFGEIEGFFEEAARDAGVKSIIVNSFKIRPAIHYSPSPVDFFRRGDKKDIYREHYARICAGQSIPSAVRWHTLAALSESEKRDVWLGVVKKIDCHGDPSKYDDLF